MKAGDLSVVQYDTVYGGMRVLPLQSVVDLAAVELLNGVPHTWVVVGFSTNERRAHEKMNVFKVRLKKKSASK